jgi:hypothetical protein
MTKGKLLTLILCTLLVLLLVGGVALAQRPERDISSRLHPNLAAAQRLCIQAFDKIVAAQQANEWDMNGHAQKAKNLLDEVNRELKLAAEAANRNAR